jgi:putative intracellular protease/amidase/YHS domain-containing protein
MTMRDFRRRHSIPIALVCLTLVGVGGLTGANLPGARAVGAEEARPKPALQAFDPVFLTEGKEVKGRAEFSLTHEGFCYVFVDAASKAKFGKDPERYAIQFHGKCAMMPSAAAQPDLFTVYKGKIYAFGSKDCRTAFQESPEAYVHAQEYARRRSVVIFVFNNMELLDFAGPAEVFASAGFQVRTVATSREPIQCMGLITITPRYTLEDCPRSDIIVVPGGSTRAVAMDKRVTAWLAHASTEADATLSVCTGAFVLANAGLLDGKEATTHWGSIERMRKQFPKITVRDDQRVVDAGKVVTSAGVSAGIDGALHVVDRLAGRAIAVKAARYMEYTWQPTQATKK